MNWFKAFWKKLTAPPPSAGRRVYFGPTAPLGSSTASARSSSPPNTPITAIRKAWRCDPRDLKDPMPNFSPRAQQVLALSRKEADRFNHNFVGTEHILLGILALGQGIAVEALMNMGLDLALVRDEIEKYVGIGPDQKMIGLIPYTPRVKKVLALAAREAKALDDTYVGTEHILLGLLREGDGVAPRILRNLDVDLEKTRAEILKSREPSGAESEQSGSVPVETPVPARPYNPLENLTPRAQQALAMAREDATQGKQFFLGTEHVLLGLARLGRGVSVNVLAKLGLTPETIAAQIDKLDERMPAEKAKDGAYYTLFVSEVLESASDFARHLNHTYIGTEHILLGLLHHPNGGAAQIFKNLNIDTKKVGEEIYKELAPAPYLSKKTAMQPNPSPAKPPREQVDTTQRYDVYCVERNQKMVVHRNVRFKSAKALFPRNDYDQWSDFVELEQPDGQSLFIAKSTIVRFCPPGAKPEIENL